MDSLALIAGMVSSFIFSSSHIPMLLKAYQTKDLHSYSALNLVLVNSGNLLYWLYVVTLPPGPIWILHTFYTISSGILLVMYWRQAARPTWKLGYRWTGLMKQSKFLAASLVKFIATTDRPVVAQCGPVALVKLNQLRSDH